jgi:hypothetical protein
MTIWILKLMHLLLARAPWIDTFPATAAVIDKVAHEAPLYDGEDGVERTAVELVALTYYESRFNPKAVNKENNSFGLGQIHSSNLKFLDVTREQLFDQETNLHAMLKLIRISHRLCKARPKIDSLANYASGGPTCTVPAGLTASRRRMSLAAGLLRRNPVFWIETPSGATMTTASQ